MNLKSPAGSIGRIALSVFFAGVVYSLWLAIFLLVVPHVAQPFIAIIWILAPPFTAAGFAVGLAVSQRLLKRPRTGFPRLFAWSLVSCALGAVFVYPFGPMVIVFGMFVAGTAAVMFIEFKEARDRRNN